MLPTLPECYDKLVLKTPWLVLLIITLVCIVSGYYASSFKLDASADSLVLENDESLHIHPMMTCSVAGCWQTWTSCAANLRPWIGSNRSLACWTSR